MQCSLSEAFYHHVEILKRCESIDEVRDVCRCFLYKLGFPIVKYAWIPPVIENRCQTVVFWSWPEMELENTSAKWYLATDPKIQYCQNHTLPLTWTPAIVTRKIRENRVSRNAVDFWSETLDLGMDYGVTIPVRGYSGSFGMFSTVRISIPEPPYPVPLPLLEAWVVHLQTQIERIYSEQLLPEQLTSRESEVLNWTVRGKTAEEIGQILQISNNTVLFHLRNLRSKLNVTNKYHLAARAFTLGLIRV
jgi:DNA-binding CsgD family transcriptional regulator